MKPKYFSIIIILIILSSCAHYRPVIDMQNVNRAKYEQDLNECQSYAEQVSPASEATIGMAIGAGLGAAMGLAVGLATHHNHERLMALGASIGGIHGGSAGLSAGMIGQINIIRRCMAGRGYKVLR